MALTTISSLFGSSPIKPLQKHMDSVQICIAELIPFIEAVLARDWKKAKKIQLNISKLENAADALKKDLRLHLPNSLLMPVSRRDLLEVLTMQDKIANKAKDVAGLMLGREMEIPEGLGPNFVEYIQRSIDASAQACKAINELDELVESGFRGREVDVVQAMIQKLDEIENETDRIQVIIRSEVRKQEKQLPPVDVMFLYEVIDWIGDLADIAQRVGSRLELMLAR